MNEHQAAAIHGIIIDTLVRCDECGDRDGLLSMRVAPSGVMLCMDCAAEYEPDARAVDVLIHSESNLQMLREAVAGSEPVSGEPES